MPLNESPRGKEKVKLLREIKCPNEKDDVFIRVPFFSDLE